MAQQQTIAMVNDTGMPNFDVSLVATVKKELAKKDFDGQHGPFSKQMFVVEDDSGSTILDLKNPPAFMKVGATIRISKGEAKAAPKRETYTKGDEEKGKIVANGQHVQLVSGANGNGSEPRAASSYSASPRPGQRSLKDAVEAYRSFLDEAFDLVEDQVQRQSLGELEDGAVLSTAQDIAASLFISWNRGEISLGPVAAPAPAQASRPAFTPDGSESSIDDDDIPFAFDPTMNGERIALW